MTESEAKALIVVGLFCLGLWLLCFRDKKEVSLKWDAPQPFARGSTHVATVTVRNKTTDLHACTIWSSLDSSDPSAPSAFWDLFFYAYANTVEEHQWPFVMRDILGTYPCWVDISDGITGEPVSKIQFRDITLV